MKVMKWSAIALAVSAGSTQFAVADAFVSDQAEAKGFIEDSSLNLLLRNYYFNRDGKEGRGDRVDWTQGFLTTYESGFTQGTVGFGVDAFGYLGLKLDGTSDKTGTGNLPVMNDGKPRDDYSRAGGAVKVRISKTMLKWGEMQPTAPVFAAGGSRLFPQTATGFQLQSSEFEGLDLEAGHFTEGKEPTTVKSRGELYATYAGQTAKSADFAGGRYAITDNLSASLYGAELKDIYRQYYLNTNYTIPLASDQSLGFDFNIYRTTDEGKSKAGDISNTPGPWRARIPWTPTPSPWPTSRCMATSRSTTSASAATVPAPAATRSSSPTPSSTPTSTVLARNPGRPATT
ncbi:Basic amino acid, basic peptide and imipenem outer membrane porin OprD precursor [Pseudomonas aeruginosa]|nr:Basic amino acid, basic peptide and imipenem outer membrane porin OprD precursor [Pseudomonas aeruginosa]